MLFYLLVINIYLTHETLIHQFTLTHKYFTHFIYIYITYTRLNTLISNKQCVPQGNERYVMTCSTFIESHKYYLKIILLNYCSSLIWSWSPFIKMISVNGQLIFY